ncbi:MAG: hypothetical protein KatS3mg105_0913 [Gemmatales bacterium]|nr:MAG: hypothetical protein KatS3mg105_0913 [Gemmatales bacterium]
MAFQRDRGGEPIPGYKLIERLGGGGFGEVWKVEAPGGIHKAIKFVYGDVDTTSEEGQRAEQELKALRRVKEVRHPYILSLERYDIIDGQLMIVMELADRNLWDRFRECRAQGLEGIPRDELLDYMEETAEALDLMNIQHNLQHLDIKPQNIFLVYNHVKVADFGLAKDLEGMVASVTGGVTPVYAAPETFDGMVTRFCDQYSLAIVYQELLTGQRPFSGSNIHQLVMQHVSGQPNLSPLPPFDRPVIARSLSKNPDDRFPTCSDMVRALREAGLQMTPVADLSKQQSLPSGSGTFAALPSQETAPHPPSFSGTFPALQDAPSSSGTFAALPEHETQKSVTSATVDLPEPEEKPKREAPPEETGDGPLMPALVIGLGQVGIGVLQQLRQTIKDRFVSTKRVPHLRLLGIDTDPETIQDAQHGKWGSPMAASELVTARLNRPLHYQKPRDGRPRIDSWINPAILYNIKRNLTTEGLRPLGRLAFIDNFRLIGPRIRSDLEACVDPENMELARKYTGLELRTNRPRAYIVSSLCGGTGSGMFIDCAYVVRHALKQLGYDDPQVIGILYLPAITPADLHKASSSKELVNAYAALTELHHFSSADVTFTSRYDEREKPISDAGPPFTRCILMPMPLEHNSELLARYITQGGEGIFRDLLTPLGRTADEVRQKALEKVETVPGENVFQTFGLTSFNWPRRTLLKRVAREMCRKLIKRWADADATSLRDRIQNWCREQWEEKQLGAEAQILRLQAACEAALGKSPEAVFAEITEPFVPRRWFGLKLKADQVRAAMDQIKKLVGRPITSTVLYEPSLIEKTVESELELLSKDWNARLVQPVKNLVNEKDFGLKGAEEAIRQYIELIDQTVKSHSELTKEMLQEASLKSDRLQTLMDGLDDIIAGGRSMSQYANELVELLRTYPKVRFKSLILTPLDKNYMAVRNALSDQLRAIKDYRSQLLSLNESLKQGRADDEADSEHGGEFQLLPVNCRTLDDAIHNFIASLTPEELAELDQRMHTMIMQQFRGLRNVFASPALLKNLEQAMLSEANAFAASLLTGVDVIEMFLNRYPKEEDAKRRIAKAFDAAAPALLGPEHSSRTEVCILGTPPSSQEEKFRELACRAIPEADLIPTQSPEDIVFYREEAHLKLEQLQNFGSIAQDAYFMAPNTESFTPHTRLDIDEWKPMPQS